MTARVLALSQGGYYVLTGLWSLLHIQSFERVTGKKTDIWLVKTVGMLVTALGAFLVVAGLRQRSDPETVLLATSSAAGLAAVEVYYVLSGRISRVYLLDAAAEAGLIGGWLLAFAAEQREQGPRSPAERIVEGSPA
jgi:hypothetical protein